TPVPLLLRGGGPVYLDLYRDQLLAERFNLGRIEAQLTAEALAGASRQRQEGLLIQIGKEQRMRLRMFDPEGRLIADSFELDTPAFAIGDSGNDSMGGQFAQVRDRAVNTIVGADPIPDHIEPESPTAESWPELQRAREQ